MKTSWLLALIFALPLSAAAQPQPELDVSGLVDAAQQWAEENLDENVLAILPEVDREQVEKFLRSFEQQLKGNNVAEVAKLREAAKLVLPMLDSYEETTPLAAWLRSRLDYFDVAEELRKAAPPAPGLAPTNPPPAVERKVWTERLRSTDWPKGAKELVPKLKPIFASESVPAELVWLAEVESGFNPNARSPVGAAGLFQLMPATAKRFGLSKSWFGDARYQPEASARAAAKYLGILRKQFGDWRLALAAYNSGEGTVQKLLTKHKARSFDGIATHLPAETQMYVPKVEATVFRREGVQLAALKVPKPPMILSPRK